MPSSRSEDHQSIPGIYCGPHQPLLFDLLMNLKNDNAWGMVLPGGYPGGAAGTGPESRPASRLRDSTWWSDEDQLPAAPAFHHLPWLWQKVMTA